MSADAAGRREALERLAARSARKGHAIARDLLGDSAEAEDAVQESLARACAGWERLRDAEALEGWFYRVLTHLCLRSLRRRRLRETLGRFWSPGEAVDGDLVAPPVRPDDALDAQRLLGHVGSLPPMQKAALVLRYGHDLGVGEIAGMLGVGEGTVKTHLVRGLARLRALVGAPEPARRTR